MTEKNKYRVQSLLRELVESKKRDMRLDFDNMSFNTHTQEVNLQYLINKHLIKLIWEDQ